MILPAELFGGLSELICAGCLGLCLALCGGEQHLAVNCPSCLDLSDSKVGSMVKFSSLTFSRENNLIICATICLYTHTTHTYTCIHIHTTHITHICIMCIIHIPHVLYTYIYILHTLHAYIFTYHIYTCTLHTQYTHIKQYRLTHYTYFTYTYTHCTCTRIHTNLPLSCYRWEF